MSGAGAPPWSQALNAGTTERSLGWVAAVVLAVAVGLLVLANIGLALSNQSSASALAERRAAIAQTPQLAGVVQLVASKLAQAAVHNNDPALRNLLSASGLTVNVTTPAPGTQAGPRSTPVKAP